LCHRDHRISHGFVDIDYSTIMFDIQFDRTTRYS